MFLFQKRTTPLRAQKSWQIWFTQQNVMRKIMNNYLHYFLFRNMIWYLQKTQKNRAEGQQIMLFFLRVALFCLQHSKLTVHISQVILHVFMINSGKNTEKGFKKKKIETCNFKMKWNLKCSHMRFCSKLFLCVWDEKRFQKATHILPICEQPNSYQHLFMD